MPPAMFSGLPPVTKGDSGWFLAGGAFVLGLLLWLAIEPEQQSPNQLAQDLAGDEVANVLDASDREQRTTLLPSQLQESPEQLGRRLQIQVVDIQGSALAECSLAVVTSEGVEPLPPTDKAGYSEGVPATTRSSLVAAKAGYARGRVRLQLDQEDVRVVLAPAATIEGRVLHSTEGDATPAVGIRVIAWEEGCAPSRESFQRAEFLDLIAVQATTDRQGQFVLPEIDSSRGYSVVAVGPGLLSQLEQNVTVFSTPELLLERLYGALIQLTGPRGQVLDCSQGLMEAGPTTQFPHGGGIRYVSVARPEIVLVGLAPDLLQRPSRDRNLILCQRPGGRDSVTGIKYSVTAPGYAPASALIEPRWIGTGAAHVSMELVPASSGRGSVVIRFSGSRENTDLRVLPTHGGTILFSKGAPEKPGRTLSYSLTESPSSPVSIHGVPEGTYRLLLDLGSGFARAPAVAANGSGAIDVVANATTECTVDLSPTAALALDLQRNGADWTGSAIFTLSTQGIRLGEVHFESAPYLIPYMPPGAYDIGIRWPVEAPPLSCQLTLGVTTHLLFESPR